MSDLKEFIKITDDDKLEVHHVQDVSAVMEKAKLLRELQPGSNKGIGKMKNYHMAASIPEVIIQKLINEGRLRPDYQADKEQMSRLYLIIQREYPAFLTTNRKLGKLFKVR